jgi:hypothetical protein
MAEGQEHLDREHVVWLEHVSEEAYAVAPAG